MDMKTAINKATARLKETSSKEYVERLRGFYDSPVTEAVAELSDIHGDGTFYNSSEFVIYCHDVSRARKQTAHSFKCLYKSSIDQPQHYDWKDIAVAESSDSATFVAAAA